ncbi:hypothetical protein ScPMuIL_009499 [Solemya velum]
MYVREGLFAFTIIVLFSFASLSGFVIPQLHGKSPSVVYFAPQNEIPQNQFTVIWNIQSHRCTQLGVEFNLSSYNITANTKQGFRGESIALFYAHDLGLYPFFLDNGTAVNGGLPQNVNLTAHLQKLTRDVERLMPNKNFAGLGVLDWESWRPTFQTNRFTPRQRVYIERSVQRERNRHPDWSTDRLEAEAKLEFDRSARFLMQGTLFKLQEMRPRARWAYYGFPKCLNYQPGIRDCKENIKKANNEKYWLFSGSNALYPSIYLTEHLRKPAERHERVDGILREALRVHERFGSDDQAIFPYSRFTYSDTTDPYTKVDLDNTIGQSFEAGSGGVILWEPFQNYKTKTDCQVVKQYIETLLGPYVREKVTFASNCSRQLCSLHGYCISKTWRLSRSKITEDYDVTWLKFWNMFADVIRFVKSHTPTEEGAEKQYGDYRCKCNKMWTGQHCDKLAIIKDEKVSKIKESRRTTFRQLVDWFSALFS